MKRWCFQVLFPLCLLCLVCSQTSGTLSWLSCLLKVKTIGKYTHHYLEFNYSLILNIFLTIRNITTSKVIIKVKLSRYFIKVTHYCIIIKVIKDRQKEWVKYLILIMCAMSLLTWLTWICLMQTFPKSIHLNLCLTWLAHRLVGLRKGKEKVKKVDWLWEPGGIKLLYSKEKQYSGVGSCGERGSVPKIRARLSCNTLYITLFHS